jgi:hypothetical protein
MRKPKGSISKPKSYKEIGEFLDTHDLTEFWGQTKKTSFEVDIESEVEPHGLKSMAPPHASSGGTLRSIPYYAP